MKTASKRIGVMVAILLLGAGVLVVLLASNEPSYQGRPLGRWVEDDGNRWGRVNAKQVDEAMWYFGTNAVPFLLQWINYQQPQYWCGTNFWIRNIKKVKFISDYMSRREYRAAGALRGFERLGPRADSALEVLNRMVTASKSNEVQRPVIALTYLGEKAVPAMIVALTNSNINCRHIITEACYGLGNNARAALPVLLQCVKDPDARVRFGACCALGRIRSEPARAVPCLSEAVADAKPEVRCMALAALGRYGTNARPALPIIVKALTDPDVNMRRWATNAVRDIAPERMQH